MKDNMLDKKSFLTQFTSIVKSNLKSIIILLSLCFVCFLLYEIYSQFSSNKIKNNSIVFFNNQNFEDQNSINQTIIELSNQRGFYGILSTLDLIQKHIKDKNYEEAKNLYNDLLNNKKLDKTYKSAIATKASYEFIEFNLSNLSKDYFEFIATLISSIDNELISYQGVKLELKYLVAILNIQKNNLIYLNNNEAIDLFNNVVSSDVASSSIKERVNKIHEFFTFK